MSLDFAFFTDPALTRPQSGPLQFVLDADRSDAVAAVLWFGCPQSGRVLRPAAGAQIQVSVVDQGVENGARLGGVSLSVGLHPADGASTAIDLGEALASGVAAAVPVCVRVVDVTHRVGNYSGLSLTTNDLVESAA